MSTVSSIYSGYSTTDITELLKKAEEESGKSSSILNSSGSSQTRRASNAYGMASAGSSLGQAALKKALSEISGEGKVTFADVAEHREKLEAEFSLGVRVSLAEAGVSPDTPFTLNMNADGTIDVQCDDAIAKGKIEEFLADNPAICEQFGYIQALSNLERARQSPAASKDMWMEVRNNTAAMQSQALEDFFGDATANGMEYSSILANFGGGEEEAVSFYTGLNFKV